MSADEAARFLREHAHYRDDLPFWLAQAARLPGPVLDLGAAAGRVSVPLARAGSEVWALDASPDMVEAIAAHAAAAGPEVAARVHPVHGDMRDFDLGRRFGLVIIAMNTLQALTEPEDQLSCLRTITRHLLPDGELIFDVALPDPVEIAETMGVERSGGEYREPVTGVTLAHSAWYDSWDPVTQTLEFTHRITETAPDGRSQTFLRRHRVHLFMPVEMEHLLARAGLETIAVMGDFDGGPLRGGGETQVRRCRAVAA